MAFPIDSRITTPVAISSKAPGSVNDAPSTSSTAPVSARSTGAPVDTVKLSLSARIHLLKSQGQGAKVIAANLGVPTSTVAAFFSAPAASSANQTAAAPAISAVPDVETPAVKVASPTPATALAK